MAIFNMTPKCKKCGNRYPINYADKYGLPTMLGFKQKNGTQINVCFKCIQKLGAMPDSEKDKFFEDLGVELND